MLIVGGSGFIGKNLLKRSRHVVEEQDRVLRFGEGLKNGTPPRELGLLLNASHQSSSKLFENSLPELDFMVSQLIGNDKVLGARLTGGGFGGARKNDFFRFFWIFQKVLNISLLMSPK